jgi:hypothetical protein
VAVEGVITVQVLPVQKTVLLVVLEAGLVFVQPQLQMVVLELLAKDMLVEQIHLQL